MSAVTGGQWPQARRAAVPGWEADNRCKPDRGIFLSQTPNIEKVLFKQKAPLEGILVMIEYIKREAQYIHGTPYVWVPSDRDFFVPHCYPRAMLHYRDEKAPPSEWVF